VPPPGGIKPQPRSEVRGNTKGDEKMAANANIKQALLTLDATATTQYKRIIKIQAKVTKGEKRLEKVLGIAKADYQNTLIALANIMHLDH